MCWRTGVTRGRRASFTWPRRVATSRCREHAGTGAVDAGRGAVAAAGDGEFAAAHWEGRIGRRGWWQRTATGRICAVARAGWPGGAGKDPPRRQSEGDRDQAPDAGVRQVHHRTTFGQVPPRRCWSAIGCVGRWNSSSSGSNPWPNWATCPIRRRQRPSLALRQAALGAACRKADPPCRVRFPLGIRPSDGAGGTAADALNQLPGRLNLHSRCPGWSVTGKPFQRRWPSQLGGGAISSPPILTSSIQVSAYGRIPPFTLSPENVGSEQSSLPSVCCSLGKPAVEWSRERGHESGQVPIVNPELSRGPVREPPGASRREPKLPCPPAAGGGEFRFVVTFL